MSISLTGVFLSSISLVGVVDDFVVPVGGGTGSPMGLLLILTYA